MSASSLLTIELGTRCNNRCAFCPQHYLRTQQFKLRELSTKEVAARLKRGRRDDIRRVAFTGGEPTVRSDLPRLIALARELGYCEIGMTTNGRMLALPDAAQELIRAGLTAVTFSLHGSAATHDRLSGIPGAHAQLESGLAALRTAAAKRGTELTCHSVTLLLPDNLAEVTETIRTAARWGATIHILQPFIASRANLAQARHYTLPVEALARTVSQAGELALSLGTRVKPYNIPYCVLPGLAGIEVQSYRLATHKRHHKQVGDDADFGQAQFHRIARCQGCPTPCPGFRVEHRDRSEMIAEIRAAAQDHRGRRMVVPGADLFPASSLVELYRALATGEREVELMLGGPAWADPDESARGLAQAGLGRVYHLVRTRWEDPEGREPEGGNVEELLVQARLLAEEGVANSLFLAAPDITSFALANADWALFDEVFVAVPRLWRGLPDEEALVRFLEARTERVLQQAADIARHRPVRLATFDNARILSRPLARWQRSLAAAISPEDWSGRLLRHPFTGPAYNFISWSNPFWLF